MKKYSKLKLLPMVLALCILIAGDISPAIYALAEPAAVQQQISFPETPIPQKSIHLLAVGDGLMHMGVINSGIQADGSYNYDMLFEGIAPFLEKADIKVINQETILGGNELGFSGYPRFNTPTELGDSISKAGFNVVLHASNHSGDRGLDALKHCSRFWEEYPDVLAVGISQEPSTNKIPIMNVDGYDFAILNYTYSPNTASMPAHLIGHLNMLCPWSEGDRMFDFTKLHPQVIADIKAARELADIVIVFPHWGTEYTTKATKYQEQFAKEMTAAGADLIIGTHPHVVEPVEWIEADNGNRALCYYSLGNYVSTQKQPITMFEAMAWVTFIITEDGIEIDASQTGALPIINHYLSGPVRFGNIYPLDDYSEELAKKHGILQYGGVPLVYSDLLKWKDEILGEFALTVDDILK